MRGDIASSKFSARELEGMKQDALKAEYKASAETVRNALAIVLTEFSLTPINSDRD